MARAKAKGKAAPKRAASAKAKAQALEQRTARKVGKMMARREAVRDLNALATSVGVGTQPVKTTKWKKGGETHWRPRGAMPGTRGASGIARCCGEVGP